MNGYEHELMEMVQLLDEKKTDSVRWSHADTLDVVSCMDKIREYAKR